ncbi:MAG: sulfite exporter TauE/SafE family protein [Gammaproteobacteria bacterium]|nr:sulfite exporter TauE/SafE family protein [Gammaproteobacteria bacterium]
MPGLDSYLLIYLAVGAIAGLSAGLLGIGGGLVIVPALAIVFQHQGIPPGIIMPLALGTSLSTIVFTSIASIRSHQQHRAIIWPLVRQLTPGILLGAWLGSWLAVQIDNNGLKLLFALFEIGVALHLLLDKQPHGHSPLPGRLTTSLAGGIIGGLSSLLGIGGGTLTVPFLSWHKVLLRKAIASSAACGLPIALSGALGYIANGWDIPELPESSFGYLHLPAFIGIICSSMLLAPVGAGLTHKLPVQHLKKLFAACLIIIAIRLLLS